MGNGDRPAGEATMSLVTALAVAAAAGAFFFVLTRIAPNTFRTGEDVNRALVFLLVAIAVIAAICFV